MTIYPQGHHESVLRSHRWRTATNSAAYLVPHLRQGMRVLDVGCGPGTITADLAAIVGPDGTVLGIDRSPDAVEVARADAGTAAVRFAVHDVMALGLPDEHFDVVHAHQVLQYLPDPVAALREMRRVTRPGGLVAVRDADYAAMTWHPESPGMTRWLEVYRTVARLHGGEPDAGRQVLGWAQSADFREVTPSASVWCFATPEDRQWWGGLQADRIVDSDVARHAVAAGVADAGELQRISAAWRSWADVEDGWFAVLHGEALCRV